MNIHFIAIGGSAMHNLAIALSRKGFKVTGSDDEIFEPSRSRLKTQEILPEEQGWFPEKITEELEAVVLGMHARSDNPELLKAKSMGLHIYSYPEYVYEQTKNKNRIVIGGSHGKTTITSMILHVFKSLDVDTDYLVGAQLEGYDCMVRLSENAPVAVIEGDEYLSSPIDLRPKFHLYKPNIALLTGIAWDHINVFPSFEIYLEQFETFIDLIEPNGHLVYYAGDAYLAQLALQARPDVNCIPYDTHPYQLRGGKTSLTVDDREIPLEIFGDHNLQNLNGALTVAELAGISKSDFYKAIQTFTGASKRLEKVSEADDWVFYKDFAHAPSKLKATTAALKGQFPERALIACMELHTFSSLNKAFLPHYAGSMKDADHAFVYFNPAVVAHKRLPTLSVTEVEKAFASPNITVFTDLTSLLAALRDISWKGKTLLMMSSGNFDGLDFDQFGAEIMGTLRD